jgi:protein involved in polysaccharide export with SLBB domain
MTKNLVLSFGLLCAVACPLLRPQSAVSSGAGDQQQDSSGACTDEMLAAGEQCQLAPQQLRQVAPSAETGYPGSANGTGFPVPTSLGPAAPEGAYPQTNYPGSGGVSPSGRSLAESQMFPPDLPTEFQKFVAETTGQFLPLYGENLFRRIPSTFAPNDQAPVPPAYVIGPDDELRIRIWGQINFSGNVVVDRSGNIYLPQIGTIPVTGLKFSELDQHLRAAIARLFRNFDLSVDIGRIRSIQVYVSGEARRPGAYTISSLSSLVDALFATGGPSPQGSLRHILLKREGKVVTDFDLYDLLIHGDKSKDVRLLPEDVLYIPPVGPEVAITGSVRNPGIFELSGSETIGDLVDTAGQTSALASNTRISLDRMEQKQYRRAMEFDFDTAGLATKLEAGDILRIIPILPVYDKTVTLRGNVANPGRFGWHPGMRLSDLIPDQDSLLSRDYWWKRSHLGLPSPEFEPAVSSLGENQQPLETTPRGLTTSVTQDTLTTALMPRDLQAERNNTQGNTPLSQRASNASLAASSTEPAQNPVQPIQRNEILLTANQINWNYAVIERVDPISLHPSLIPFELGKLVMDHDASQNIVLQPGDTVTIFSQSDIRVPLDQQVKYVELEGEFVRAGYYSAQPGETLRDVVRRAGGLTSRAYLYGSEFTRESARIVQQQRLDDYTRSLTLDAERGTQALAVSSNPGTSSDVAASQAVTQQMIARLSQVKATGRIVLQFRPDSSNADDVPAISLENGDKFIVGPAPTSINVVGAVYNQNSFDYHPGRTLGAYLRLAGGPNRDADWRHAFLIRADGSVISRTHFHGEGFWKESFEDVRLFPGDTIVVPDKTLRPTALRGFMDWSQVFSQLALGAAAINVL